MNNTLPKWSRGEHTVHDFAQDSVNYLRYYLRTRPCIIAMDPWLAADSVCDAKSPHETWQWS